MTAEHGGVSGEDGGHVDVTRATHNEADASDPLVEMCHQVGRAVNVLLILAYTHIHTYRATDSIYLFYFYLLKTLGAYM